MVIPILQIEEAADSGEPLEGSGFENETPDDDSTPATATAETEQEVPRG